MVGLIITCSSVGVYGHAIKRGNEYKVIEYKNDKVRIKGNHGKQIWIDKSYFNLEGNPEPTIVEWQFDDEDIDSFELLEVTITFNNGLRRWCLLTTPDKLLTHFNNTNLDLPGMNIRHLIINKTMNIEDIDKTLKYLDQQGELYKLTIPLE